MKKTIRRCLHKPWKSARLKVKKHGADKRRTWRKMHLATDEATNYIHAVELTTNSISYGAYDQVKVYDELSSRHIQLLIPLVPTR